MSQTTTNKSSGLHVSWDESLLCFHMLGLIDFRLIWLHDVFNLNLGVVVLRAMYQHVLYLDRCNHTLSLNLCVALSNKCPVVNGVMDNSFSSFNFTSFQFLVQNWTQNVRLIVVCSFLVAVMVFIISCCLIQMTNQKMSSVLYSWDFFWWSISYCFEWTLVTCLHGWWLGFNSIRLEEGTLVAWLWYSFTWNHWSSFIIIPESFLRW